jgi:hypothetical protein
MKVCQSAGVNARTGPWGSWESQTVANILVDITYTPGSG